MKHLFQKTLVLSVVAAGILLAAPAIHAENEGISAAAKKMEKREARRELSALKKYDANGNGVLDAPEAAAKKADAKAKRDAATLKKYDANGNGVLDPDELAQEESDLKTKHDAAMLKKYDKNGNGVLDPDEQKLMQANADKMKALREAKERKAAGKTAPATKPVETVAATEAGK
jgi:hypothetical protein